MQPSARSTPPAASTGRPSSPITRRLEQHLADRLAARHGERGDVAERQQRRGSRRTAPAAGRAGPRASSAARRCAASGYTTTASIATSSSEIDQRRRRRARRATAAPSATRRCRSAACDAARSASPTVRTRARFGAHGPRGARTVRAALRASIAAPPAAAAPRRRHDAARRRTAAPTVDPARRHRGSGIASAGGIRCRRRQVGIRRRRRRIGSAATAAACQSPARRWRGSGSPNKRSRSSARRSACRSAARSPAARNRRRTPLRSSPCSVRSGSAQTARAKSRTDSSGSGRWSQSRGSRTSGTSFARWRRGSGDGRAPMTPRRRPRPAVRAGCRRAAVGVRPQRITDRHAIERAQRIAQLAARQTGPRACARYASVGDGTGSGARRHGGGDRRAGRRPAPGTSRRAVRARRSTNATAPTSTIDRHAVTHHMRERAAAPIRIGVRRRVLGSARASRGRRGRRRGACARRRGGRCGPSTPSATSCEAP